MATRLSRLVLALAILLKGTLPFKFISSWLKD